MNSFAQGSSLGKIKIHSLKSFEKNTPQQSQQEFVTYKYRVINLNHQLINYYSSENSYAIGNHHTSMGVSSFSVNTADIHVCSQKSHPNVRVQCMQNAE